MIRKDKLMLMLIAAFIITMLSACSGGAVQQSSATPSATAKSSAVNLTDMLGRTVTLSAPATKVVVLTAADCEILFALGAGSTIVGRGEYCDYPAETAKIPSVQSGSNTNIEQIIALNPQIVIMSKLAQTDEQIAALEKAGIKVLVSYAQDISGTYKAISLVGTAVGKNSEADKLVSDMKAAFSDLAAKAKGGSGKTIYLEIASLQNGLWAAGKGTFMDEIANMLGLKNIFSDVNGWAQVSQEQVISRSPDYIITFDMYYKDGQEPVKEILGRKGWENITAIKGRAVTSDTSNALMRPGPRLVDGAKGLYSFVYGDK